MSAIRFWYLTDKEREVLEKLILYGDIKTVAEVLGLKESVVRQRLYRLRQRYQKAKQFCIEVERYKARLPVKFLE